MILPPAGHGAELLSWIVAQPLWRSARQHFPAADEVKAELLYINSLLVFFSAEMERVSFHQVRFVFEQSFLPIYLQNFGTCPVVPLFIISKLKYLTRTILQLDFNVENKKGFSRIPLCLCDKVLDLGLTSSRGTGT